MNSLKHPSFGKLPIFDRLILVPLFVGAILIALGWLYESNFYFLFFIGAFLALELLFIVRFGLGFISTRRPDPSTAQLRNILTFYKASPLAGFFGLSNISIVTKLKIQAPKL